MGGRVKLNYHPDVLDTLIQEVEIQRGALLPDPCTPIKFKAPKKIGGPLKPAETQACGNDTLLVSVYDPGATVQYEVEGETVVHSVDKKEAQAMIKRGHGFITACAVCDNMGAWPRYKDAVDTAWDELPEDAFVEDYEEGDYDE